MSQRELVRLRDRYPTTSRMSLWRLRKEPGFPDGIDILGTEYFYSDELEAYEESRRRRREQSSEAASVTKPRLHKKAGHSRAAAHRPEGTRTALIWTSA